MQLEQKWRNEHLKVRQLEIVMEELGSEVEKRAALVKEQQVSASFGGVWVGRPGSIGN
jgi:hypothetical protein